ncbi:ABC transporter permease [Capillibacterium thermochitinicola]|nr:ABC transporter permease [Capillibacterium thermochitinicola]
MRQKYGILLVLVVLFVISSLLNENFLSIRNLTNISRQISITTILAFGETILIICGMLDLSCGSVLALAGLLSVSLYKTTGDLFLAFLLAIAIAVLCNILNGLMVTKFDTPPFIATLAMMTMARGAALLYTNGQNIYQIGNYIVFGQGSIGGVPTPIIFLVLIAIVTWYLLNHTRLGRSIYAIGGNEEAAIASGINVKRVKMKAYIINGLFVGLAGVIFMSRVNAGLPNGAVGFEFEALTASIIGGTSFSGGIGTAWGTIIGAFIVGILNNIMNLVGLNAYLQQIIRGAIIALAVIYDMYAKKMRVKRKLGSIEEAA